MKNKQIISENPKAEIWGYFSKFSYEANVRKHLVKVNDTEKIDETLITKVTGAIQQAINYFEQAENASLYIKPLLLYYGSTNLYYAICILKTGRPVDIGGHGIDIVDESLSMELGKILVRSSDKSKGGLRVYSEFLFDQGYELKSYLWTVGEIFSGIPDLKQLCEESYDEISPHCIPLQEVKTKKYSTFRFAKDEILKIDSNLLFQSVHKFKDNFIRPEGQQEFFILRKKLTYKGDCFARSTSGQKYLQLLHFKNEKWVHVEMLQRYLIGLFALGRVCRYNPDVWFQFIKKDETGEKHLVEKFMELSTRQLPHLLYEKLIEREVSFVFEGQNELDLTNNYSENELKELIKDELDKLIVRKNLR